MRFTPLQLRRLYRQQLHFELFDTLKQTLQGAGIKPLFVSRETNVTGAEEDYLIGRLNGVGGVY